MADLFSAVAPAVARPSSDGVTRWGEIALRGYQSDVADRARARAASAKNFAGRHGIIQGETGAGKTPVLGHFAGLTWKKGKRALLIVDRRRLVLQMASTLDRMTIPYGVVMDASTRNVYAPCIIASRDTLDSWLSRGMSPGEFDTILFDECHKVTGDVYQRIIKRYPNALRLGFTATPQRTDGKSLSPTFAWIESMVSASQLIAEGYLIRPEIYAPKELAEIRKSGLKTKGLAGDPVTHWRRHADGLPTVAFTSSSRNSRELRDRFIKAGITAECIGQSTSDDERERIFDRVRENKTKVLCSVRLLIEGVDIPELSCAILWSKFGSLVDYRQALGRIMRPAPWAGKTRAVGLDHAGAAGVHGLPGEDIAWELGGDTEKKQAERFKSGERDRTVFCGGCGLAYTVSASVRACPECGAKAPKPERKKPSGDGPVTAQQDAILDRMTPSERVVAQDAATMTQWQLAVNTAIRNGRKAASAAAMFKSKTGKAPWECPALKIGYIDWQSPAVDVLGAFAWRKKG